MESSEAEFLLEVCFFSEALAKSEQGSLLIATGYGSAISSTEVHNLGPEIASLASAEKGSVCAVVGRGCPYPGWETALMWGERVVAALILFLRFIRHCACCARPAWCSQQ